MPKPSKSGHYSAAYAEGFVERVLRDLSAGRGDMRKAYISAIDVINASAMQPNMARHMIRDLDCEVFAWQPLPAGGR